MQPVSGDGPDHLREARLSRTPWIFIFLGAAAALLGAGMFVGARRNAPSVAPAFGAVLRPSLASLSVRERAEWIRRAERYVRWVLDHSAGDLDALSGAREISAQALAAARLPGGDPALRLSAQGLWIEIDNRWKDRLQDTWSACYQALSLRDWPSARAALRSILRAVKDSTERQHRKARLLLERIP